MPAFIRVDLKCCRSLEGLPKTEQWKLLRNRLIQRFPELNDNVTAAEQITAQWALTVLFHGKMSLMWEGKHKRNRKIQANLSQKYQWNKNKDEHEHMQLLHQKQPSIQEHQAAICLLELFQPDGAESLRGQETFLGALSRVFFPKVPSVSEVPTICIKQAGARTHRSNEVPVDNQDSDFNLDLALAFVDTCEIHALERLTLPQMLELSLAKLAGHKFEEAGNGPCWLFGWPIETKLPERTVPALSYVKKESAAVFRLSCLSGFSGSCEMHSSASFLERVAFAPSYKTALSPTERAVSLWTARTDTASPEHDEPIQHQLLRLMSDLSELEVQTGIQATILAQPFLQMAASASVEDAIECSDITDSKNGDESHNATVRAILETSLSTGRMPTWDEYRRIIDHGADLSSIDPSIHEVVDRVLESGQWHLLLDFECKERDA
eukprot:TRINITY_DN11485_c0_g1_i8.p1 TRINITY_DN11485_c0_g1~~TRINITY_DN11485_c0_g1_i8.p1  ORF type:complete len:437 (+),score=68.43 TRINITY_DN11485_c0_g1_i8:578-1888(+)